MVGRPARPGYRRRSCWWSPHGWRAGRRAQERTGASPSRRRRAASAASPARGHAAPRRRSSIPRPAPRSRLRRTPSGGRRWPRPRRPPAAHQCSSPTFRSCGFRGRPGSSSRSSRRRPIPVPVGDGARHHHGRPQARSGISLAGHAESSNVRSPSSFPSSKSSGICIGPTGSTPANTRSASSSIRTTWTTSSIAPGW